MQIQRAQNTPVFRNHNSIASNSVKNNAQASNESRFSGSANVLGNQSDQPAAAFFFDASTRNPMDDADTLMRAILAAKGAEDEPVASAGSGNTALDKVTQQFQQQFSQNASNKDEFHSLMKKSFGENYDQSKAEGMRQQSLSGDFSWMPNIELVDSSTLTNVSGNNVGAVGSGAYSATTDTIYLSRQLVESNPSAAVDVLTEEVGHGIDARINTQDAAGDEGSIFARLSSGENISDAELAALRSENDTGTIVVDGKEVEVEFFLGAALGLLGKGSISKLVGGGVGKFLTSSLGKIFGGGFSKFVSGGLNRIFGDFLGKKIFGGLSRAVSRGVKSVAKKVGNFVEDKVIGGVKSAAKKIGKEVERGAKRIGKEISRGVKNVTDGIRSVGRKIGDFFGW